MTDDVFASPEARRSALVRLGLLVGSFVLTALGVEMLSPSVTDPGWVQTQLAGLGRYAPLAFVALQTVQVIFAPVPGQMLGGIGGFLFGGLRGTVYSMLGVVAGSAVVFFASRRFGRPYVERVVAAESLERWDAFFERGGLLGLFALFLLPTFPDDLLCFVAGLADIQSRRFLTLVLVGRTPSFLLAAYVGTRVADGALLQAAAIVTALGVLSAGVYCFRRQLLVALENE
ncbi:MAG: TVP38/TMEM64 family protein [Halobellus sp.]|uniref:TVP38/TMEM64 family protein n=1 Tax=Halobellus sp. TaxID=1979212 RepID=UPI0035D48226